MIQRIIIHNYRCFRNLDIALNQEMNILVGDNDAGKSTLIEAINLALTSRINGKLLAQELSPYLFNTAGVEEYLVELRDGRNPRPPEFTIDVFLTESSDNSMLRGTNNAAREDAVGVRIRAALCDDFAEEYAAFVAKPDIVRLVPCEYYTVDWLGFSGNGITYRSIPATASLIDASTIRLYSGADFYLQGIISEHLDRNERVELSRTYRSLREQFSGNDAVKAINTKLATTKGQISDRELSLSIDISQRSAWESSLVPHLDDLPFQYVGKGEQNTLKILLALERKLEDAHIILIEEPENHLSFSTLNILVSKIAEKCSDRQVVITTHSSFVLNKLGLESLILLSGDYYTRLSSLPSDTEDYFKKLSGYDTLRLVLAKRVILVEGPSDELIVQRAYMDVHGHLPIFDGIDVINVRGLSFSRFLDLAVGLERKTAVVRDNDGKDAAAVEARYAVYTEKPYIRVHVGRNSQLKTLEPQLLAANSLAILNDVFGTSKTTDSDMHAYMEANKAKCALKIFEHTGSLSMPDYIRDVVA